jgi:hypothetical protein
LVSSATVRAASPVIRLSGWYRRTRARYAWSITAARCRRASDLGWTSLNDKALGRALTCVRVAAQSETLKVLLTHRGV